MNIAKVLFIHSDIHLLHKTLLKMYNVQFMIYIVYMFSQNVQECTILLNFQIHCVQNVQNVHSSHPVFFEIHIDIHLILTFTYILTV